MGACFQAPHAAPRTKTNGNIIMGRFGGLFVVPYNNNKGV